MLPVIARNAFTHVFLPICVYACIMHRKFGWEKSAFRMTALTKKFPSKILGQDEFRPL